MVMYALGSPTESSKLDDTITQLQLHARRSLIHQIEQSTTDIVWAPISQALFDTTFGEGMLMYLRGIGFVVCLDGYLYSVEFGDGTCVHQPDMRLRRQPLSVS